MDWDSYSCPSSVILNCKSLSFELINKRDAAPVRLADRISTCIKYGCRLTPYKLWWTMEYQSKQVQSRLWSYIRIDSFSLSILPLCCQLPSEPWDVSLTETSRDPRLISIKTARVRLKLLLVFACVIFPNQWGVTNLPESQFFLRFPLSSHTQESSPPPLPSPYNLTSLLNYRFYLYFRRV